MFFTQLYIQRQYKYLNVYKKMLSENTNDPKAFFMIFKGLSVAKNFLLRVRL